MRIEFKRSGGFAPIPLRLHLDTESLPEADAQELIGLIAAADFFHLPASIQPPAGSADRFQYEITVEGPAGRHTVRTSDAVGRDELQRLLSRLTVLAKARRTAGPS
jgi:hypothetical protein